jgi:hypothetical protein
MFAAPTAAGHNDNKHSKSDLGHLAAARTPGVSDKGSAQNQLLPAGEAAAAVL